MLKECLEPRFSYSDKLSGKLDYKALVLEPGVLILEGSCQYIRSTAAKAQSQYNQ
jgi:cytoskeletal protein CcmA (bactofilin family)